MLRNNDLIQRPLQKPNLIQPDCPVYLHAYACTVTAQGATACVQIRFVNRADRIVDSIFLRIRGIDEQGNTSFELRDLTLAACHALPRTVFGENQAFLLPRRYAEALEITVERILFEDGIIWRRMPSHLLVTAQQAGWTTCSCGMKNPPEEANCIFCAKPLSLKEADESNDSERSLEQAPLVPEIAQESDELCSEPVEEIAELIPEIPEPVEEIAETIREIPEPVEEIAETIAEIPEPVEEIAETIAEIPEPVEEIAETIAEIPVSVDEVAEPIPVTSEQVEEVAEPVPEIPNIVEEFTEQIPEIVDENTSSSAICEPIDEFSAYESLMQETTALLRELKARTALSPKTPEALETVTGQGSSPVSEEAPAEERKGRSKALIALFWTLAILAIVAIGVVGYLYANGLLY